MPTLLRLTDASATRSVQLTLSNVVNDAYRAVGTQGDGLSNDGSSGIWPGATNLCTNGGFTTNTTGWSAGLGTETLTRQSSISKFGGQALKVDVLATAFSGALGPTAALTNGTAYTFSAWVNAPNGSNNELRLKNAAFSNVAVTTFTGTGAWQRVSVTYTAIATENHFFYVRHVDASALTFYVDGVQYETGSVATPYIETDGGTAARSASRVQMPWDAGLFTATQGWVAMRCRVGFPSTLAQSGQQVFWAWKTTQSVYLAWNSGGGGFFHFVAGGGASIGDSTPRVFATGDYITLIAAWQSAAHKISYNGGAFLADANGIGTPTGTTTEIGSFGDSSQMSTSDYLWFACGNGIVPDALAAAINNFGNTKPTIRALDSVARGARAMAVWDGRTNTFQRRIAA